MGILGKLVLSMPPGSVYDVAGNSFAGIQHYEFMTPGQNGIAFYHLRLSATPHSLASLCCALFWFFARGSVDRC